MAAAAKRFGEAFASNGHPVWHPPSGTGGDRGLRVNNSLCDAKVISPPCPPPGAVHEVFGERGPRTETTRGLRFRAALEATEEAPGTVRVWVVMIGWVRRWAHQPCDSP
jgi:hypothetical protein